MPRPEDLTGRKFGKWTVLGNYQRKDSATYWTCRCECGIERDVAASSLKHGTSTQCQSCASTIHGMAGNFKQHNTAKEYNSWHAAKSRCTNPNNPKYADYGGRGIYMDKTWMESFKAFYDHIDPCPEGMILDRENNDLGYVPGNVRWVTYSVSNENRRNKRETIS